MNVFITDPSEIFRLGLTKLFESTFPDAKLLPWNHEIPWSQHSNLNSVDLFILSEGMNNDGQATIGSLVKILKRPAKILVLSDRPNVLRARHLFKLGANAYIDRGAQAAVIAEAVTKVMSGKSYLQTSFLIDYLQTGIPEKTIQQPEQSMPLSLKELELADYLIKGFTTSEISRILNKKPSTISGQKSKVYQKLRVNNIVELLGYMNRMPQG